MTACYHYSQHPPSSPARFILWTLTCFAFRSFSQSYKPNFRHFRLLASSTTAPRCGYIFFHLTYQTRQCLVRVDWKWRTWKWGACTIAPSKLQDMKMQDLRVWFTHILIPDIQFLYALIDDGVCEMEPAANHGYSSKDATKRWNRRLLKIGRGGRGRKLRYQLLYLLKHFHIQVFHLACHYDIVLSLWQNKVYVL